MHNFSCQSYLNKAGKKNAYSLILSTDIYLVPTLYYHSCVETKCCISRIVISTISSSTICGRLIISEYMFSYYNIFNLQLKSLNTDA